MRCESLAIFAVLVMGGCASENKIAEVSSEQNSEDPGASPEAVTSEVTEVQNSESGSTQPTPQVTPGPTAEELTDPSVLDQL